MIDSVLVIGGGIAGIQTSLELSDLGFKVYLIEKNPSIGGHMAQLEKTFPTNDCSLCMLAPKMVALYRNPNIELLTLSKLKSIEGEEGDFSATIVQKPRYIDEIKCRGCGDCAAKCPKVETPNEFDRYLGKRKSAYIPFPQATPPVYLIDPKLCLYLKRNVCGVCSKVCQAGAIDYDQKSQEIVVKVGAIVVATGFDILGKELTPRWGYQYQNVVNALDYERILSSGGPFGGQILRLSDEKEPKRVAFIQCAGSINIDENVPYCSRVCCLYTAKEAVLTREYSEEIEAHIFRHKLRVFGKNYYDLAKKAQIDKGVVYHQAKIYKIEEEPKTNDLNIQYKDLGTGEDKVFNANLVVLASPLVYSKGTKKLSGILGVELDRYGFFKEKDYFNKFLSSKEGVFLSGSCQSPMDISETVANASGVASLVANYLKPIQYTQLKDYESEITNKEGSVKITPAALVIGGGVSGMTAALNIAYQGFETYIIEKENQLGGNLNYINILYPTQREASGYLSEIKKKIIENENIQTILNAKIRKIEGSVGNYEVTIVSDNGDLRDVKVGTIIIATGGKEFKPRGDFLYNIENKNILTQMDLEQKLKENDESWLNDVKHITLILCVNSLHKDGFAYCSNVCCNNAIKNINILKKIKPEINILVFFRDLHLGKREYEDYFNDSKNIAKFIRYNPKNTPEVVKINQKPERYRIKVQDDIKKDNYDEFTTDMIILCTQMIPSDNLEELANMLKVPLDENGFFEQAHPKLRPLDFANHGIFLCGCAQWPKDVQDSILQANGAAGRACKFLNVKEVSSIKLKFLSFLLSIECYFKDIQVNTEKCNGCGRCVEVCSFKAINLIDDKKEFEDISMDSKKAFINSALCKGCGKCASACRLKAITAKHYNYDQISSIIDPYFLEKGGRRKIKSPPIEVADL